MEGKGSVLTYFDHATVPLDAEIPAGRGTAPDVSEQGTFQVQEGGEGSRHQVEKDSGHGVSNGDWLMNALDMGELAVHASHIDDARASDWGIAW